MAKSHDFQLTKVEIQTLFGIIRRATLTSRRLGNEVETLRFTVETDVYPPLERKEPELIHDFAYARKETDFKQAPTKRNKRNINET